MSSIEFLRDQIRNALLGDKNARRTISKGSALLKDISNDEYATGFLICHSEQSWSEAHWFAAILYTNHDSRGIEYLARNAEHCLASAFTMGIHFRESDVLVARRYFKIAAEKGHYFSQKELAILDWNHSILFLPWFVLVSFSWIAIVVYRLYKNELDPRTMKGILP
jgi:hypothetical protein